MAIDVNLASAEQIQRGLELLERETIRKEKIARGEIEGEQKWSDLTPEQKQKFKDNDKRRRVRQNLIIAKAVEAGIEVTDDEVEMAMLK